MRNGEIMVEKLSDYLSALADFILDVVLEECWRELNGDSKNLDKILIVGYGKLGSRELGYLSDLDLVFLYPHSCEKELKFYINLVRLICTWLRTKTSAGYLYEVDLQLRPYGSSGLLVTSFDKYANYIFKDAWTWEHQAITKARPITGEENMIREFDLMRRKLLSRHRNRETICNEIISMRNRMIGRRGVRGNEFDLKNSQGGLVDIEFGVQALVLLYSDKIPELTKNLGNIKLLEIAACNRLVSWKIATDASYAYRRYRKIQHQKQLEGEKEVISKITDWDSETHSVGLLIKSIFQNGSY